MKKNKFTTTDLTEGTIWKKLLIYFLPIFAGSLFQQLYNAVDAIIVGKFVGTQALAAVGGSASLITNVMINFFVALTGGSAVVIAQYYGAHDDEDVSEASHTAVAFCILCGIAVTVVGIAFAPWILDVMKTPADTMQDSLMYLRIYFSGTIFILIFNVGSSILRAVGDSNGPFRYLCVSCFTNIMLDLFFVLVFDMGVEGVAIATVIAQAVAALFTVMQLFESQESYKISISRIKITVLQLKRMLRIGIPNSLQSIMYGLSNGIVQTGLNTISTVAVAAWALDSKLDGLFWAASNAAGVAITNFVGQNKGANRMDRVSKATKESFKIFGIMSVLLSALIMLFAKYCLFIFTDDPELIDTTWTLVLFFVPVYITWIVIEVLTAVLRGVGDTVAPTIILALGICLLRVVWIKTLFVIYPTLEVICLTYPVSWVVTDIAIIIYYAKGKWKEKTII